MNVSPRDVEQIVQEVLRRLREREGSRPRASASERQPTERGELQLAERVVSLAALRGKLEKVRVVVAPRGAVVTPAARDELKTRNIRLEYATAEIQSTRGKRLLLACTTRYNPQALVKRLASRAISVQQLKAESWQNAVQQMTETLSTDMSLGLVLAEHPAAAACLANRNPAIRAAAANDLASVADAVTSLDANLLVIDPAAQSLFALENIIREYARLESPSRGREKTP